MKSTSRLLLTVAAVAVAVTTSAAAQQTVRIRGVIDQADGTTLHVKQSKGLDAVVKLSGNVQVFDVVPGTLADVKKNSFIGVGAMPQPDGSQKAIQVTIFAESQRGTGEGFRPWDKPGTTMTNATVENQVVTTDGQVITVKYKGGEKKIVVDKAAVFRLYKPGSKDELKPGAQIGIARAAKQADGTLTASRVNVGHNGAQP